MDDTSPTAEVVGMPRTSQPTLLTVAPSGAIIASSPTFDSIVGAGTGSVAGRRLDCFVAPDEEAAIRDLLVRSSRPGTTDGEDPTETVPTVPTVPTVTITGRRDDGLPLVLHLVAMPSGGAPGGGDGVTIVASRAGGPVTWSQETPAARPPRTGPDHVLSHDARAGVRNARNFVGLFARKLSGLEIDPELVPTNLLETGLRAMAVSDEILDRIVWYLRLADDPIAMQPLPIAILVEMAGRISQSNADELAVADGQEDLARPIEIVSTAGDGGTEVVGNHELLVWVLAELFTNARKFAGEPPTITVGAVSAGDWLHLTVHNSGRSVDPTLAGDAFGLGRMLQPRGERPGVGLGLPLCRRILTRHGGRIRFDTGTTAGTQLSFRLLTAAPQLSV